VPGEGAGAGVFAGRFVGVEDADAGGTVLGDGEIHLLAAPAEE